MNQVEEWVFIVAGVILTTIYLIVIKDFVGEIVAEMFFVWRQRFNGGDYEEEMQATEDYVKKSN